MLGIVQGCPLSPFLFNIAMTCLMADADRIVTDVHGPPASGLHTRSLLYADDTLIVEASEQVAQFYVDTVREQGKAYGFTFNESKLEVLSVKHLGQIRTGDGSFMPSKDRLIYLGGLLSADGRVGAELSRRLGLAERTFTDLQRVWKHANITRKRKVEIFEACVVSRLLYGLQAAWLNKSERRRLNAFQCRCLRRILSYRRLSTAAFRTRRCCAGLTDALCARSSLSDSYFFSQGSPENLRQTLCVTRS